MENILEELFYGDVQPAEQRPASSALYEQCSEASAQLYGSLNEGQKKLFLHFEDCENARVSQDNCRAFAQGFSLAVRLLAAGLKGG